MGNRHINVDHDETSLSYW